MKNAIKIFLIIITMFSFSSIVLADPNVQSDDVNAGKDGSQTAYGDCPNGVICQADNAAGVRITFVDEKANSVSYSYDFSTRTSPKATNMRYNVLVGDKSRYTGGYHEGRLNLYHLPAFSDLVARVRKYIDTVPEYSSGNVYKGIKTTGDTGGMRSNSFKQERAWFGSLTENTLQGDTVVANVNAFMQALQELYPTFDANAMRFKLTQGCKNGNEIYIQLEPLFMLFTGKGNNLDRVFGTMRELVQYYTWSGKGQQIINKLNSSNFLWAIYYDRPILSPNFIGYAPITPASGFKLTNALQFNERIGFGVALDWANSPEAYCNQCVFENGNMYYEDKPVTERPYPTSFRSAVEYALRTKADGGLNCCGALENQVSSGRTLPNDWQNGYNSFCKSETACSQKNNNGNTTYTCLDGKPCTSDEYNRECKPEENCCNNDPITPGKITGDINNCCTDGTTSKASEYNLDELFCNPNNGNIQKKCGADYYLDDTLDSKYCSLRCTERIEIEQPGAITATSGRYFTLTKTSAGTTSPHIMAYRRCRVTTDYDKWEKDYGAQVELEVKYYNEYQANRARAVSYENAKKSPQNASSSSGGSCSKTVKSTCKDDIDGDGDIETYSCNKTSTRSYSCTIYYKKYEIRNVPYFTVSINPTKRANHTAYEILQNSASSTEVKTVYDNFNYSDCERAKSAASSGGYNCGGYSQPNVPRESIDGKINEYNGKAGTAQANYNAATSNAKNLEKELDRCQHYFTDHEGKNADKFNINTKMSFNYTQVYMDSRGELILDKQSINFKETPGCKVQATGKNSKGETIYAKVGPDATDGLQARRYSANPNQQEMSDFRQTNLSLAGSNGFRSFLDVESGRGYMADKAFSHDAKYTADCRWDEDDNEYYTLIPSGESSETTSTINYIRHGQEYRLHLTTLDGTYQTYWQLTGVGSPRKGESAGRFDEYLTNEGHTCAGDYADGESSLTCKLHIEYEVILTGKCNGINGTDTTVDPDSCEPYREGYNLFTFKIADPANLFPNGTTDKKDGDYAYNWVSTSKGQTTMDEIQKKAARSETYSHDNLTYSYILTPTDMRNIKNYNKEKNDEGGYSDFDMKCDCSGNACVKCKSNFLEELSKGNIIYDNQDHRATGWANSNKSIDLVRQSFGW